MIEKDAAVGTLDDDAGAGHENDVIANEVQAPANEVNAAAPEEAPVDPKSPAAAKNVVEHYAKAAEKGEYRAAAKYWSDPREAAQFAANLEDYPKVKMTVGGPTDEEGAAGSIFINVPLTLDLTLRSGSPYQRKCKAVLRRVNDVPGSTEAQRRWHIESVDC